MESGPRSRPPAVRSTPGVSRTPVRLQPARRLLRPWCRALCPPLTYRARGVPTAIQRPTPRRRKASSHKVRGTRSVPCGCPSHRRSTRARDLAPARLGPSVSRKDVQGEVQRQRPGIIQIFRFSPPPSLYIERNNPTRSPISTPIPGSPEESRCFLVLLLCKDLRMHLNNRIIVSAPTASR